MPVQIRDTSTTRILYIRQRTNCRLQRLSLIHIFAGAVGRNQLAPVTAGFFLPPARALGTTAFALLVAARCV